MGVTEHLESLGLKDLGTSERKTRAVFRYDPLVKLYKLEIPSLFGRLLHDEGLFLDRADPELFETELDEILKTYGPSIWPVPGQGPRDHLLDPDPREGSRYPSALVYPRDSTVYVRLSYDVRFATDSFRLKQRLRALILSKSARPGVDIEALIEKRHRDAVRLKCNQPHSSGATTQRKKSRGRDSGLSVAKRRRRVLVGSYFSVESSSSSESEDSVVVHTTKRRTGYKKASMPFKVALRIYRKAGPNEIRQIGPCRSYKTIFLTDGVDSADDFFAYLRQSTDADCTHAEFHPPEDMSLEGRIRVVRGSEEANNTFQRVLTMLRDAQTFPGGPTYRTIEVEVGHGTGSEEEVADRV